MKGLTKRQVGDKVVPFHSKAFQRELTNLLGKHKKLTDAEKVIFESDGQMAVNLFRSLHEHSMFKRDSFVIPLISRHNRKESIRFIEGLRAQGRHVIGLLNVRPSR